MRNHWIFRGVLIGGLLLSVAGCNKTATTDTNASYKTAINNYYQAHPECLWPQPKKFPVQAATSDDAKTQGYDALTDAGLLTRTTAEKKVMIIASKQVNNYDVSPQGRSSWTQDPTQPGYGNFCYGHREVTAIDHADVTTNSEGAKTAQVNYHFKLAEMPSWAQSQEMQTAFPQLNGAQTAIQPAHTTLVMNGNNWQINK